MVFGAWQGQASPGEPQSRGHPLSYWLELEHDIGSAERTNAEAAIREIGTTGLPAMLVWLRYDGSPADADFAEFLARMQKSASGSWVPPGLAYEDGTPPGYLGFNVLGPAAAPAIAVLAEIANDARHPRPAVRALMALSAIGPAALPAVEARLANPNFPFPTDAAINMYLRTRTSTNYNRLSAADARPILIELQTNANPVLVQGATQLLDLMKLPSGQERGKTKSFSEALSDLETEGRTGRMGTQLKPGWNIPAWSKLSPEEQRAASNAVHLAVTAPPARPKGDEPYPYPLQPGTPAWDYATVEEVFKSIEIPKSWREQATSWQLFRSAIGHPYFRAVCRLPGDDIGRSYSASRSGEVSILQQVDTAPEFGTNVLRWLNELDLAKLAASGCEKPYEPCLLDYSVVWYMAGLDSALGTLDVASRQRLYRLAVWDADYFLSRAGDMVASGPVGLIYILGKKPESFRGVLPAEAVLSPPSPNSSPLGLTLGLPDNRPSLRSAVAAAKAALGLKERP
jgi:hypothetical protein